MLICSLTSSRNPQHNGNKKAIRVVKPKSFHAGGGGGGGSLAKRCSCPGEIVLIPREGVGAGGRGVLSQKVLMPWDISQIEQGRTEIVKTLHSPPYALYACTR